jgi:hypothetical protein
MRTATIEGGGGGFAPGATALPARRDLSGAVEERIAQRLERLLELESGWGEADAKRPGPDVVATAARLIYQAISAGLPEPELFPVPDGGVQVEWRAGPVELELEIEPSVVFVCDEQT